MDLSQWKNISSPTYVEIMHVVSPYYMHGDSIYTRYGDSMESDTFYEDFMVKLMRRFSGNFIYHVFFI